MGFSGLDLVPSWCQGDNVPRYPENPTVGVLIKSHWMPTPAIYAAGSHRPWRLFQGYLFCRISLNYHGIKDFFLFCVDFLIQPSEDRAPSDGISHLKPSGKGQNR